MFRVSFLFIILGFTCVSCKSEDKNKVVDGKETIEALLQARYSKFLNYKVDSTAFARSYNPKTATITKVPSGNWTSGFFAGNFWQIYMLTRNEDFKNRAEEWTAYIEKEKYNDRTHDMGFKVFCSFGNGLKVKDNQNYKDIIVKSAKTLSTRFDDTVGSIRSWDFNEDIWQFPVIIDNMMNLELLFEATKISGDSTFHKIAVKHANTTLKNHFREDASTWHVLDYDTISGQVRGRVTHQGISDDSAWARGQGWAINGFTTVYRYTKDDKYLNQAIATANFFINHKNMPEDGVPYWDFDHPDIPNISRDVSAAAIVASALIELYQYTKNEDFLNYSKKVCESLKSRKYILPEDIDIPFILDHSFGDWSLKKEMDEPIAYGDYYFLQTLLRLKALQK
ncbi:glycoside hydrolase family 88 protein [Hyunsoonleella pacifica]|uniref:Glucuronyl hydrolase n=1 Tax=Hyunsoonleella pacifica TaxID=1080224 RepID=A0A4Q9FJ63_9FLAO|nr:glycoside hydrolase family 88 protein [Hyunsoonleella pacifica]TBN13048.1 glucuronyl hydrolase [Hyunsoonleella pacifica]GGD27603.1 glucuronyl hydrolase [Hyunsoonleella pacifica]